MKTVNQGEIFLANLNPVKGHEQSGLRPVLVVQKNILNQYLSTIIIVPITSNLNLKGKLTTYFLPRKNTNLKKDSLALIYQVRTLDKSRLVKKIGHLNSEGLSNVKFNLSQIF